MSDDYRRARERYRVYRRQTRELIEEETLPSFRFRVDVVAIDDDILRKAKRDWYECADRRVGWDWEADIIKPLHGFGPRTLDAAFVVKGQLCALMAARLSPDKRWLSLTFLEGCPVGHPLKGSVVALAIRTLYIYRAVICSREDVRKIGIRILRPTQPALDCYRRNGFDNFVDAKRDPMIIVESGERRV